MIRRSAIAASAALAATAALLLASCSSTSSTSDSSSGTTSIKGTTVTLATDASYPPCEYFEKDSKTMVGFEPDIWNAIAKKIGVKLKVENTDFDSLIPGVQSGRYDVAMECISDRAARQKQVTFLDFIYAETAIIVPAAYSGPITASDPLSICGQSMGGQTGFDTISLITDTINPACKAAGKDEVKILQYPKAADTYNALYSGRVDFIVLDTAAAAYLNKTAPVKLQYIENSKFEKLYLGAIFNKSDKAMQAAWEKGLKEIIADGTYDKILKDWDLSSLALEDPGVNLAVTRPIGS